MNTIDLSPLYRSSVGFDRLGSLLDAAFQSDKTNVNYPPYNIKVLKENHYSITLAVAGFSEDDIELEVENGVLTITGRKQEENDNEQAHYLHKGIGTRSFQRKFNLADHIEVTGAELKDGLLNIALVKEVPEAMKPKKIAINNNDTKIIQHEKEKVA